MLQANPGDKFDVVRSAGPTTSPACSSAWYEVARLDGSMFSDPKLNPGTIPTLWICGDYVTPIGGAPAPSLSLSSSTVAFSATQGGADPAPATVNVTGMTNRCWPLPCKVRAA